MALAGTGIQIGSATQFGQNIRFPRALATDGTTVWLFDANRGYTLNPTTGVAIPVAAAVTDFGNNENQVRSATYHNGQVLVFGRRNEKIQVFNTTDGTLSDWHSSLIGYADSSITGRPDLWGFTSLDGTLYALDRETDALYICSSLGALTRVGNSSNFGINARNTRAFTAYRGALIAADTSIDKIFSISETAGAGTIIGSTNNLPDNGPEALVEFGEQLFLAGSQNDAWFRLYDVLWDETIDAIEVDEGGNGSLDLSTVSQDASSFEFAPGRTARSWVTLSGTEVVITNAADVTADTDFEEVVRAVRDGVHADKTLTVTVRDTTPPPPLMITAPLALPNFRVTGKGATYIDVAWDQGDNGGAAITDHEVSIKEGDAPGTTWNATGSTSRTHRFSNLKKGTEYTCQARGINTEGEGEASAPVTTITDTTVPGAPTNQQVTPGTGSQANTAEVEVDPPEDTGGLNITGYQSRHAEGTTIPASVRWVNRGVSPSFILPNLKKGTEHAVEVRAVNPDGEGASTGITTFTTHATEPDLPTLNLDTIGIRDAEFSWQNGEDGGSPITGHQFRIVEGNTAGGRWEDTDSLDTMLSVSGLMPSTEYTAQVRTLNDEGESQPSNAVTFTTQVYVPKPPVWQTGSALRTDINAGETRRINIGALVTDAASIEEIFGLQFQWMDYNESTQILTLTDAPIIREDTDIRIRFLASNDEGEVPADYIITLNASVLASLHNSLFFVEPLNYEPGRVTRRGTQIIVTELTDNDYTTFSTHTDFDINLADANGNATGFNYIFIKAKGKNITYTLTPTGGSGTGVTNRRMPESIKNIGGGEVSTVVNGFTHDLYPFPERVTATSVRLQITGTDLEIYAVMLLKRIWEIDANSDYIDMVFEKVDRAGKLEDFPDGSIERVEVLGAERWKWEAEYTATVDGSDVDEFMDMVEANLNCGFAREFSRHPADVYPAFFPALEMPNGYLGLVKSVGESIQFGVFEQ